MFILILHGDYVFIMIMYSWPLVSEVMWPNIWEEVKYRIKNKNNFRKAKQIQGGLNHGDTYMYVYTYIFPYISNLSLSFYLYYLSIYHSSYLFTHVSRNLSTYIFFFLSHTHIISFHYKHSMFALWFQHKWCWEKNNIHLLSIHS